MLRGIGFALFLLCGWQISFAGAAAPEAHPSGTSQANTFQIQLHVVIAQVPPGGLGNLDLHSLRYNQPANAAEQKQSQSYVGVFGSPGAREKTFALLRNLIEEGRAKLLPTPPLVTLTGQPVSFFDGTEYPVPVPPGPGSCGVQFAEVGTRLDSLPTILSGGKIHLQLETEISALGSSKYAGSISSRTANEMTLEQGQTLLIGGLHKPSAKPPQSLISRFISGIWPVPEQQAELVIFVTPVLVPQTEPRGK